MRGVELKKLSLLAIARYVAVVALIGAAAFPVYWMFVTSLTPSAALFEGPSFLPRLSEFGNTYLEAFQTIPIATWLLNSLIVAAGTTVLSIAISLYPAYALSRFDFRGKGLAGLGLFVTQMLPEAMLVVPLYAIFGQFNMLNSLTGLIFVNAAFSVPVIIWILKGAIDGRYRGAHRAAARRPHSGSSSRDRLLPWLERIRIRPDDGQQREPAHRLCRAGRIRGRVVDPDPLGDGSVGDLHDAGDLVLPVRPAVRRRRNDCRRRQRVGLTGKHSVFSGRPTFSARRRRLLRRPFVAK